MYAGAAREAVFAVPAVIRKINSAFIPLALRAPLVNGPDAVRDEAEKWLYQRLNRAKLAPQGIAVLNSAGQVLSWVQMFDDDQSVLDFLDHGRKRFGENADARQPELLWSIGAEIIRTIIVTDDLVNLRETLYALCEREDINLVITSGGTGFGPRDNTPEATRAVIEREAPGLSEAIRRETSQHNRSAACFNQ